MKITKIFVLIFFAAAQIFAQESSEDSFILILFNSVLQEKKLNM